MLELSLKSRNLVLGIMTVIILAAINLQIAGKEKILRDGTVMLLQLAPRDPRSLLQGDYMALRYRIAQTAATAAASANVSDGQVVVFIDDQQVATYRRIHNGEALQTNERLLQFRKRGDAVRLASDAFFFQEGTGENYFVARYGEIRVDADGHAVLTGMRDSELRPL